MKPAHLTTQRGRNDPCGCGSGKKYKACCIGKRASDNRLTDVMVDLLGAPPPGITTPADIHVKKTARCVVTKKAKTRKRKRKPKVVPASKPKPKPIGATVALARETAEIITVTPAMARDWLANHNYEDNRKISQSRVDYYARLMANGLWKYNGETLIFDKEGGMLNGQHRLSAVIQSKKSIKVLVARGVATDSFTTMDQGYNRTGAQVFGMKGHGLTSVRSSICRALYIWETTGTFKSSGGKISPDELLLVHECYEDEVEEALFYANVARKDCKLPGGMLGLAHVLFKRARPRKANGFLNVLADGITNEKAHPAVALRKRVINDKLKGVKWSSDALWCALVRAWNAYDRGISSTKCVLVKRDGNGGYVHQAIRGIKTVAAKR